MPKVSACMVTYGRWSMVNRSIAMFLAQTLTDSELVIMHTDSEQPLVLGVEHPRIKVINNSLDYITGLPYTNTGAIRRDCLTHASGEYYVCWDDDDVFLPWALHQAYDNVAHGNKIAWKPANSFYRDGFGRIELTQNTMEASCIIDLEILRSIGFNLSSGPEGLSWYIKLRDAGYLKENEIEFCPAYCFDWQRNNLAAHKQSGDIDNPNNFNNHIKNSTDRPAGRVIWPRSFDLSSTYAPFYAWIINNSLSINQKCLFEYASPFLFTKNNGL